jgi:hypothetical protein
MFVDLATELRTLAENIACVHKYARAPFLSESVDDRLEGIAKETEHLEKLTRQLASLVDEESAANRRAAEADASKP